MSQQSATAAILMATARGDHVPDKSDKVHPELWRLERTGRLTFVGPFKWFIYVSCLFSMLVFLYALYYSLSGRTINDFDSGTLISPW